MCCNFISFIAIMAFYQSQVSEVRSFQEKLCLNFKKIVKYYFSPEASLRALKYTTIHKVCTANYLSDLLDFYTI